MYSLKTSLSITVLDIVLKELLLNNFIKLIGAHLRSEEVRVKRNAMFYLTFFSGAVMLVLLASPVAGGRYSDFDKGWYQAIGT